MIVWIDGPYGVGKSTLAETLHGRRPDSFVFDAEAVGNAVRDNLPLALFNGYIFEGYPLWFETCAALLGDIAARYQGTVYVPMTLTEPGSFEKIARPLREQGVCIKHILLEADCETVRERILARGEEEDCWCMQNIGLCLARQRAFKDVIRINTAGRTPEALAAEAEEALKA